MEKLLKVVLKIRIKNGGIKVIVFDKVADIYTDYENNRFSLEDFSTGLEYRYHFKETGKERDGEATDILSIEIKEAE